MLLAPLCAAMGTPQPRALQGTAGRGCARGAAGRTRAVGTEVAGARNRCHASIWRTKTATKGSA